MSVAHAIGVACLSAALLASASDAIASEVIDLAAKLSHGLADGERRLVYGIGFLTTAKVGYSTFVSTLETPGTNMVITYEFIELAPCRIEVRARYETDRDSADMYAVTYDFTRLSGTKVTQMPPDALSGLLPDLPQPVNNVRVDFAPEAVAPDSIQKISSNIYATSIPTSEYAEDAIRLLQLCPPAGRSGA